VRHEKVVQTPIAFASQQKVQPVLGRLPANRRDGTARPVFFQLLATHKTDRNDARRPGAFGPNPLLQVGSREIPASARRPITDHRSQELVGQRVTLENQIRGLVVVFGVRLPRARSSAFIRRALQASEGTPGLSAALGSGCGASTM
jgi:hypothetical protein